MLKRVLHEASPHGAARIRRDIGPKDCRYLGACRPDTRWIPPRIRARRATLHSDSATTFRSVNQGARSRGGRVRAGVSHSAPPPSNSRLREAHILTDFFLSGRIPWAAHHLDKSARTCGPDRPADPAAVPLYLHHPASHSAPSGSIHRQCDLLAPQTAFPLPAADSTPRALARYPPRQIRT